MYLLILLALFGPLQADRISFRLITAPTEAKAAESRARVVAGEPFENVAKTNSTDSSAPNGGLMGPVPLSDLRRELRDAVSALMPGQVSPVFKVGNEYFLVQRVAPEEMEWTTNNTAALDAFQKHRYDDAAKTFLKAIEIAEKFGADDDRLGQSLNGLVETYVAQENFAAAGAASRRVLSIRWSADTKKGDPAIADLIDRFADLLSLAYFRNAQFTDALKKYQDALNKTAAAEPLYLAMSSLLTKAELTAEAEDVMQRAVRALPASRRVRYKEAEMHRDLGRMLKALETFEAASQMKAPVSMPPELDRSQLSFIYQRIAGINIDLGRLDAAVVAYRRALEISPENADARVALGDAYLRRGQPAEAIAEYKKLLETHSDRALPHYRLADAYLQSGNFAQAVASADAALKIDAKERKARYVRGMALVRMGRTEEGQAELQEYRTLESAAQQAVNARRDMLVANRGAAALLLNGQGTEAIALFKKDIEAHPEATASRLNCALALSMLGQHREAASMLQSLLESGFTDDFVVYRALAHEHEVLKDPKTSAKYASLYVRKADAALEQELQ